MKDGGPLRQILVINCGSSSLKFTLLELPSERVLVKGLAERLGEADAVLNLSYEGEKSITTLPGGSHAEAMEALLAQIRGKMGDGLQIAGIGHRVVHGGEYFSGPTRIDGSVLERIEACIPLAPLHNPAHLQGMRAAMECFPGLPQVAVFDTAFHQTLPPRAFHYALPREYYERYRIRRYGAHGTSHQYVAQETARRLGQPLEKLQLLTAHLGNGCSACAVWEGRSLDTTMGLTPLEGLMMGTRSGDADPNLHAFLAAQGKSLEEITHLLNRESGLLGVSGLSNDMRTLSRAAAAGHEGAALAIDLFCYRLAKGLLALTAALSRLDALVFTGGIGENQSVIREQTLSHLQILAPVLDHELNAANGVPADGRITTESSPLLVLVIPTNEELMIARETAAFL